MIALGIPDLDALRIAAIANNAPVSYGGLGSPVIALAAVAGAAIAPQLRPDLVLMQFSAAVGHIVALLALLPPWILIYLVSGRRGLREGWPLALTGSLGYVAGQFPVAVYLGPYLPDVVGAIVCFIAVFTLLKFWRPRTILGHGGRELTAAELANQQATAHGLTRAQVALAWMPFIVLILVVVIWTGPWSPLPKTRLFDIRVQALSSLRDGKIMSAGFHFNPFVGGSAILAAWILVALLLGVTREHLAAIFRKTWQQMWGALLVGAFLFGLAFVYNYSGMAGSLAYAFSKFGTPFLIVAPILGWIGVALSGSNTSTNVMFGAFQAIVGRILGFPLLLLPALNTVGAELGKPIAPQTASVGVATTRFVRNEGAVIRHNFGWTLVLLAYLVLIGVACYLFFPGIMQLPGS
jgi:lactate permease